MDFIVSTEARRSVLTATGGWICSSVACAWGWAPAPTCRCGRGLSRQPGRRRTSLRGGARQMLWSDFWTWKHNKRPVTVFFCLCYKHGFLKSLSVLIFRLIHIHKSYQMNAIQWVTYQCCMLENLATISSFDICKEKNKPWKVHLHKYTNSKCITVNYKLFTLG